MSARTVITADVRVTDGLDRLVITPRDPADVTVLSRALRGSAPAVSAHRSAAGLWIAAKDAHRVPESLLGVDLRWSAEAKLFTSNRSRVWEHHARLSAELRELRAGGRAAAETLLHNTGELDVLDDHQWVNVAAMTLRGGFGICVFDEQGTGKTVTLIYAFDVLVARDEVDFILIVAPKSMVPEWPQDFERFRGDLYRAQVVAGNRAEKRAAINSGADVLVTNFETAVSMEPEFRALLRRYGKRSVLVVDESFYIKNVDAARTRALRRLREWCGRAFVLCGTPAPNSPDDLIEQFTLVDFGFTFADTTLPKDRVSLRHVVQQAVEERGLFVRHLKAEVLSNLPIKRFNRVVLQLAPQQRAAYSAALHTLISDLREADDLTFRRQFTSFLARRSALLQICSNPKSIVPGYNETPAKLAALEDLLGEAIGHSGEKVVLWSFYTVSIEAIMERFQQFNPVRYDGSVVDVAKRRDAVRRFQDDDKTMLFVGNPAAAGAGLTLHRARLAIYESMSNQAAHYLQSIDRIHRRGQIRDVDYLILLCENTIETEEYQRLVAKEQAAQELLGDQVEPPVTRETMLADALRLEGLLSSF